MSHTGRPLNSIAIIGAGIIGLSCALELAARGLEVTLYDKAWPPRGASWAAAGMLAPAFEAASEPGTHPDLYSLCEASAEQWPHWAKELETLSGLPSGYQSGPSLALATTSAQVDHLEAIRERLSGQTAEPKPCLPDLAMIEPAIRGEVHAAWILPSDGQVDNRQTLAALIAGMTAHPNISIQPSAAPLNIRDGKLNHAGHDATLICAGWGSAAISVEENGISKDLQSWAGVLGEIKPFGGQMLSVRQIEGAPTKTIRCGHLYIVPKHDRIIIGATTEPGRVITEANPDAIADLRARAIAICPILAQAEVLATWAGVRPGTVDHAPILGETRQENLFVAAGHYRNGILLAPITAKLIADLIVDENRSDLMWAFAPRARRSEQV